MWSAGQICFVFLWNGEADDFFSGKVEGQLRQRDEGKEGRKEEWKYG